MVNNVTIISLRVFICSDNMKGKEIMSFVHYTVYHGTKKSNSFFILKSGFHHSKGDIHWLGDGVYFFDSNHMAFEWCKAEGKRRKYNEYAILVGELRAKSNEIFDLRNDYYNSIFHRQRENLVKRISKASFSAKLKQNQTFDGAIINSICTMFPYKIVICLSFIKLVKDRQVRVFSRIPNCIIFCVKDNSCIESTRLHKEGILNGI